MLAAKGATSTATDIVAVLDLEDRLDAAELTSCANG